MTLNPQQNRRKQDLLDQYKATGYLTPSEANELKDLIEQDQTLDEGVKLLLLFALVALIIYASKK